MIQPRDYQSEAVQSVYDYFTKGLGDAPLIVSPTGSGKSLIGALLMQRALVDFPGTRILLTTHIRELIVQDHKELMRLWPGAPAGIYSAGLGRRQAHAQLLFAGVQSIYRKAAAIGHVDLMLVDEAHLVGRNANSQYGRLISELRDINPLMKIIGMSATPFRLDSGMLHRGKGAIFDGIAYDIPIAMLVERGYLCPLISKRPGTTFDLSGLHRRAGDFIESEMAARFATDEITSAAVSELIAAGRDRKAWLTFCINVDHAHKVRDEIRSYGISCETVTGNTPTAERDRLTRAFREGHIRCLTSVNVISTGFDAPNTDLLALMRPTASTGLYLQQAGRGMRLHRDKENCLVLDFANVISRHGPVDGVALPGEKQAGEGEGEAPTKACPECGEILLIAARECLDCGFEFPAPEPKIERTASTEAVMLYTAEDEWQNVQDMDVRRHRKAGSPDSLRVEYLIGGRVVSEWVCIEHAGRARQSAVHWWQRNAGGAIPETVGEALDRRAEIARPTQAVVVRDGKYHRIKRLSFEAVERMEAAE